MKLKFTFLRDDELKRFTELLSERYDLVSVSGVYYNSKNNYKTTYFELFEIWE